MTKPGGFESEDVGPGPTAPWDIGSMSSSFTPNVHGHFSETENVAYIAGLSPQSVEATGWSSRGTQPINEFNREGYITQAFPTLFPTGAAEYLALLPTTVTHAYNTIARMQVLQVGSAYVIQNPGEVHFTIEDLRMAVKTRNTAVTRKILHFMLSMRGSPQYRFATNSNLSAMITQLGKPQLFMTG